MDNQLRPTVCHLFGIRAERRLESQELQRHAVPTHRRPRAAHRGLLLPSQGARALPSERRAQQGGSLGVSSCVELRKGSCRCRDDAFCFGICLFIVKLLCWCYCDSSFAIRVALRSQRMPTCTDPFWLAPTAMQRARLGNCIWVGCILKGTDASYSVNRQPPSFPALVLT